MTTFAWIIGASASGSILATNLQGVVAFLVPTYEPKVWHQTFIMWGFLLLALCINVFLRSILNIGETLGGVFHVLFFIACIIVMTTLGERTGSKFVFQTLTTEISGWTNPGVCFSVGLLSAIAPLAGYDSILHMIDETQKPRERVPKTMLFSILGNVVMQLTYAIVLLSFMGDVESALSSSAPLLIIYYNMTNSKAIAVVIFMMHMSIMMVANFNIIASASRLAWAFARDKGLPFHEFFSQVRCVRHQG